MKKQKLRPSLSTVLFQLLLLILGFLAIRWFFVEPFTVPSGSMFPNLLINDYIAVNKLNSGLKIPFTRKWAIGPKLPQRGLTTVFWFEKDKVFFVKRLMGLPGDEIKIKGHQILEINGQPVVTTENKILWETLKKDFPVEDSQGVVTYIEDYAAIPDMGVDRVVVMYSNSHANPEEKLIKVPPGKLFFMGDHRSASSDSRVWGFVDINDLVGPLSWILFSCQEKNPNTQMCDLKTIRWDRFLTKYHNQKLLSEPSPL